MSGNGKKNLTKVDKMINRLDDIKTSLKAFYKLTKQT